MKGRHAYLLNRIVRRLKAIELYSINTIWRHFNSYRRQDREQACIKKYQICVPPTVYHPRYFYLLFHALSILRSKKFYSITFRSVFKVSLGVVESFHLLGNFTALLNGFLPMFRDSMSVLFSRVKMYKRKGKYVGKKVFHFIGI